MQRKPRVVATLSLLVGIAVLIAILWRPSSEESGTSQTMAEHASSNDESQRESPEKKPDAAEKTERATASSPRATPTPQTGSAPDPLLLVLEKYSGSRNWLLDKDDSGRVFKISGGPALKGVMKDKNVAFLDDLQEALGFTHPALFDREEQSTARVKILDLQQKHELPDGTVLPVFASKVRLLGDAAGDAFMVHPNLRPISQNLQWAAPLTSGEAQAIAQAHVGADYEVSATGTISIFALSEPHQKVTEVIVRRDAFSRRLLIGHTTKSVVWDRPLVVR